MFSHSVVSDSLQPHGTPPGFLCPWGFSRQEYWSGLPCPPPGDLLNPGIEPRSPALWVDSLLSEPPQKPKNTGVDIYPFSRGSSQPRNWTRVSCIAGGFFTSWATREAWIKAKHLKIVTKLWHRMIPCQHGWAINTSQYFAPGNWHCSFYPIWWLQLLTTVAVTITYYLREGRVMGERNINPTANQPVSPGWFRIKVHCKRMLEPRSHLCVLFHWGRESVYSNVQCWIHYLSPDFHPIFYFFKCHNLSVVHLHHKLENHHWIYSPIPSHYWSYISIFLVSIKSIFFFTSPIIIWWKYLCVFFFFYLRFFNVFLRDGS